MSTSRILILSALLWVAVCWPFNVEAQMEAPTLVMDIVPGTGSSCPQQLAALRGQLIFDTSCQAEDRLWISNGIAWGTRMVQYVEPGVEPVNSIRWAQQMNNILYFNGYTQEHGFELWRTDGTDNGTYMVVDLASIPVWISADPIYLTVFHDQLCFFARYTAPTSFLDNRFWCTDGTTQKMKDLGIFGRADSELLAVGDKLYFTGESWNDFPGTELYRTDGTAGGTRLVRDIVPGVGNSFPASLTTIHGLLYFRAQTPEYGGELWRSDGTEEGTTMVKDAVPGALGTYPQGLTAFGDQLIYAGVTPATGYELWRSDGTVEGTQLVKDIYSGTESSMISLPIEFFPFEDTLFFRANDGIHGAELWYTDGTITGTAMLKDIRAGLASSSPEEFMRLGEQFYFVADDGRYGRELWRSDGSAAGTVLVADLYPGRNSSSPTELTVVGDRLYFAAEDKIHGRELWTIGPPMTTYIIYVPLIISHGESE